jgi:hypothetical protein
MPPTLVHAALGAMLGAALLEDAYSRRALGVVALAAVLPDLDAPLSILVPGLHGAALHTLLLPLGLGAVLYGDARRARPWLVGRFGPTAHHVAAVALLAWVVAGTGLDLLNLAAANPVWPLDAMFYSVTGKLEYTTTQGVVQTFYNYSPQGMYTHYVGQRGAPPKFCNPNAWNPTCTATPPGGVERIVPAIQGGWQVLMLGAGVVVAVARDRLARRAPDADGRTR